MFRCRPSELRRVVRGYSLNHLGACELKSETDDRSCNLSVGDRMRPYHYCAHSKTNSTHPGVSCEAIMGSKISQGSEPFLMISMAVWFRSFKIRKAKIW
jgi:hypothetical protein